MLKITGILNELSYIVEITDSSVFHGGMDHLIFRGQADEKWSLLPNIFRDDFKHNIEDRLIAKYKQRFNIQHNNIVEILAEMQHYGMPTRLLDWTSNFLVALYFAVENDDHDQTDAVIYILDSTELLGEEYINVMLNSSKLKYFPSDLHPSNTTMEFLEKYLPEFLLPEYMVETSTLISNFSSALSSDKVFDEKIISQSVMPQEFAEQIIQLEDLYKNEFFKILTKPVFIEPYNTNERIIAQSSAFTLHFGNNALENMPAFGFIKCTGIEHLDDRYHAKLIIKREDKRIIRNELSMIFGMSSATIYPDDKNKVLSQYVNKV